MSFPIDIVFASNPYAQLAINSTNGVSLAGALLLIMAYRLRGVIAF
jgi:hypothetical protein